MDDVVIPFQVQLCCPAEEYPDFSEMCELTAVQGLCILQNIPQTIKSISRCMSHTV